MKYLGLCIFVSMISLVVLFCNMIIGDKIYINLLKSFFTVHIVILSFFLNLLFIILISSCKKRSLLLLLCPKCSVYTVWASTLLYCSSSLQILKFGHHNFYRNMTEMITIVFFIKDLCRETSSIESEPAILLVLLILQNETSFQTYFSIS